MGGFFDYLRMILGWHSAPEAEENGNKRVIGSPIFRSSVVKGPR